MSRDSVKRVRNCCFCGAGNGIGVEKADASTKFCKTI